MLTKLLALLNVGLRFAPPNLRSPQYQWVIDFRRLDAIQHLFGFGVCHQPRASFYSEES
ncbi:hypothetical protein BH541_002658 [Salmonella enterica subsp. enterica serovar Cannstatt]|uniref:Uncharacterized protein n=1 Tax=Salmonella enterica subsp. enterica serovar Kouka TaxID=2564646 RepID=A0A729QIQ6_SALET|nr:hypothetical protein [Salmonella enterica subsp. enterica serovar Cannstatt]EDQ1712717.1 hypothetical protein [Salmonella enterica]EDT6516607.1 hypothetical protein [Salmonella enterica subsp. enterica]HAE3282767.1 hypothetical protein [Salmonella enterica subsp. enterica serovar Kouka]EDR6476413.1 hypothetical protein [Salmonella enterica subsp. enterica serovar Cannstatt]